jgi:hypothetical protein
VRVIVETDNYPSLQTTAFARHCGLDPQSPEKKGMLTFVSMTNAQASSKIKNN